MASDKGRLCYLEFKGLKATNEGQDDWVGILHQVAQFPIGQVYLYTRRPCPSLPMLHPETEVLAAEQVALYTLLNPPTPCLERQLKRVGGE